MKPRTFLCATGTSLAANYNSPFIAANKDTHFEWDSDAIKPLADEIKKHVGNLGHPTPATLEKLSTETNLLARKNCASDDEVVLLVPDAGDTRVCAEALAEIIRKAFGAKVTLTRVEGLQLRDFEDFKKTGIVNLVGAIYENVKDENIRYYRELCLCPMSGYESAVPFLTAAATFFRLPSVYTFEGSEALLHLPPIPVAFDKEIYEQAKPAIEWLQNEGTAHIETFWSKAKAVPFEMRTHAGGFLEFDKNDNVSLSPLASVIIAIEGAEPGNVFLSETAADVVLNATGRNLDDITRYLNRLGSPLWRSDHFHAFAGTDLSVFKVPHTAIRFAGFLDGNKINICVIYTDHDLYEHDLVKRHRDQFEGQPFSPWTA